MIIDYMNPVEVFQAIARHASETVARQAARARLAEEQDAADAEHDRLCRVAALYLDGEEHAVVRTIHDRHIDRNYAISLCDDRVQVRLVRSEHQLAEPTYAEVEAALEGPDDEQVQLKDGRTLGLTVKGLAASMALAKLDDEQAAEAYDDLGFHLPAGVPRTPLDGA